MNIGQAKTSPQNCPMRRIPTVFSKNLRPLVNLKTLNPFAQSAVTAVFFRITPSQSKTTNIMAAKTTTKRRKTTSRKSKFGSITFSKFSTYIAIVFIAIFIITQWDFIMEKCNELKTIITETVPPGANNTPTPSPVPNPSPAPQPPPNQNPQPVSVKSIKIVTWNLYNMGISKDDDEVRFAAETIKNYDLVALQEISTTLNGPRAIAKLNEELNRRGAKWDYVVSEPTSGEGSEKYVFLYKTQNIKVLGNGWLVNGKGLDKNLDREPFMVRFDVGGKKLLLANFHAVPTAKNPAKEALLLSEIHSMYPTDNLMIMGDFNLSQSNPAFDALKSKGYKPALVNQKTSLKTKKDANGNYLAEEYDNIFYRTATLVSLKSGIIDFVPKFKTLAEARHISDHLPVWCEIAWK